MEGWSQEEREWVGELRGGGAGRDGVKKSGSESVS